MNRMLFAIGCVALSAALLWLSPAQAHREAFSLAGGWSLTVTPQRNPDVPTTPPPFKAMFAFERGGTLTQTDSAFHPRSAVKLFPNLGPMSASDGWGVWEAVGGNDFRARFVKILFDESGQHLGYLITQLDLSLRAGGDRIEATADSAFVLGTDPDAAPYFSGGMSRVTGARLRVGDN